LVAIGRAITRVQTTFHQLDGARCGHNYGNDGSDVTLPWGCARETLALLLNQT
jgi:hypothetical protein